MKLYAKDKRFSFIVAKRSRQPKMTTGVIGRTFDYMLPKVDGVEVKFWLDTTWGRNAYFTLDGLKWWSVPIYGNPGYADLCPDIDKSIELFTKEAN